MFDEVIKKLARTTTLESRLKILKREMRVNEKKESVLSCLCRKVDQYKLSDLYESIKSDFKQNEGHELTSTASERIIVERLKRITKSKVETQFLIGNICLDIFLPNLAIKDLKTGRVASRGIAIEVDGPIHNSPQKVNKDIFKEKYLNLVGISLFRINNIDRFEFKLPIPKNYQEIQKFDYRSKTAQLKRIKLLTVIAHSDYSDICALFKHKSNENYGKKGVQDEKNDHSKAIGY